MATLEDKRMRPWIGRPPRTEPPEMPGFVQVAHARIDLIQLSIAGIVLVPFWWFVFDRLVRLVSGATFHTSVGLVEVVVGAFVALLVVPVIHEAAHGLAAILIGVRPSFGVGPGYAYTTVHEPLGRYAYLAVGLAPLVLIGAGGVGLAAVWPSIAGWLVFACVVNAAGAIGDLWMAWCILRLPRDAIFVDLADGFAAFVPSAPANPRPAGQPPAASD